MTRDLTPEGQKLLDSILKYQDLLKVDEGGEPPIVQGKNRWHVETERLRMEMMKMIVNSLMVIEDCDEILSQLTTAEGYMNSDAKVAKTLHYNNIGRLQRVLQGYTAFDQERNDDLMRNLASYLSKVKL